MKSAITSGQSAMGNLQNVTGTGLASLGTISKGLSATFGGISNALGSIAKALVLRMEICHSFLQH